METHRLKTQTLVENLGLYRMHHHRQLREIRRELRRLERRSWWMRIKAWFQIMKMGDRR
jgi:hypothetical protein